MADGNITTSLDLEITEPDGFNLRRSFVAKPSASMGEQNKHRASTGSCQTGGNLRRNSTGKLNFPKNGHIGHPNLMRASIGYFHDLVDSGRNSTAKPSSPNSEGGVIPRYLRASTGSCHDLCKYGRKHEVEVKARHPIRKRVVTPPLDSQYSTECGVLSERKMTKAVRPKHLEVGVPVERKMTKVVTPKHLELGVPVERKITEVVKPRHLQPGVPAEKKTTKVAKLKYSPVPKAVSPESPSILRQDVSSSSKNVEVSSKQAASNETKIAHNEKKKNFSGNSTSVKPKTITVKPSSSPAVSGGLNGRKNSEVNVGKRTGTLKAAVKKVLVSPAASLSPKPSINRVVSLNVKKYRSLKLLSPLKDQNRISKAEPKYPNSEVVAEKTLHVIKVETENKVMESTLNDSIHSPESPLLLSPKASSFPKSPALSFHKDVELSFQKEEELSFHEEEAQEEFEYTDSEADEYDNAVSEGSETSDGNRNQPPRKAGVGVPEDKDCTPTKLKFRRGKVVDLQSENSGPRRLRFRRGRVLGEKQDGKADVRRRSFKKRGADDRTNGTDADSRKVVLRHQDVQGKKDAQGLFNNVIEETASKLVESRKSKVKALVGAFETVISLQEKPPAQAVD